MSSVRRVGAFLAIFLIGLVGSASAAFAQGWGEQAPVQFKYSNQGMAEEVYRNQLGATAAAAAASSASGGGAPSQSSSQLNNAIQLNSNNTYNVTVTGSSDYLNFGGGVTVNAQQTSTGTTQTSSNTGSNTSSGSPHGRKNDSSPYLN